MLSPFWIRLSLPRRPFLTCLPSNFDVGVSATARLPSIRELPLLAATVAAFIVRKIEMGGPQRGKLMNKVETGGMKVGEQLEKIQMNELKVGSRGEEDEFIKFFNDFTKL